MANLTISVSTVLFCATLWTAALLWVLATAVGEGAWV